MTCADAIQEEERGANVLSPAQLFGPLLGAVQSRRLLGDGKEFVDAVPLRPAKEIMTDFPTIPASDAALRGFLERNFALPAETQPAIPREANASLRQHIRSLWSKLERPPVVPAGQGSALAIEHPHVVPGGRFREMYYWDSFFTMLGLLRDDRRDLATGMVDAMTDLIERFGYVPNGTRTYYLGRSQPPLYYLMVALLGETDPATKRRRLAAMKREHAWWMAGSEVLEPGARKGHVVRLASGEILNRYWDPNGTPRDESWREDVQTAELSGRVHEEVYRDLRAGAESGWDFSSRWLGGEGLTSIRTTSIAPIDLNGFLFGLETAIAEQGDADDAAEFGQLAERRRDAVIRHCWNDAEGFFADLDLDSGAYCPASSAATLAPLLVGLATQYQADAVARFIKAYYLAPGGLRTTLVHSAEQWDSPNGWAPLNWIAVKGLARYGYDDLAREIALRWISTVNSIFQRTTLIFEKYDIEGCSAGSGGEYISQTGFGWTNGVTAEFIDWFAPEANHLREPAVTGD